MALSLREARILTATILLVTAAPAAAQQPSDGSGVEFFESRVRPVLAENCYTCHGPQKQRSGLRLDSLAAILRGGDRGPAIMPGNPDASLLVQAIRYTDDDLRMPPKGRISDGAIADLMAWVKRGAPGPRVSDTKQPVGEYDLARRREHWAYQPVRRGIPSPAGRIGNPSYASPIDAFVLKRLDEAGLKPAPAADRRALIRRVTYDLTGLPPTPAEVDAFLADAAPDAYERLVDRLLASQRYGERWARHWLDLVRFAETLAYEFDYDLYNSWRYRDYVIRAFNADLPYDRFVVEHLAGDLLPQPRRHPRDGFNESIIATGFFLFGEGKQTPVDVRQDQADRIDNQIDVFGKAFLAQTVACARCHDHKFDAISTRDYYALAGFLKSSRAQQAFLDPPERITARARELEALRERARPRIDAYLVPAWRAEASLTARYLDAVGQAAGLPTDASRQASGLSPERLKRWAAALEDNDLAEPDHPLHAWRNDTSAAAQPPASAVPFEDFAGATFAGWHVTGDAFGAGPTPRGDLVLGTQLERPVTRLTTGGADSAYLSRRLQGELRSRTFTLEHDYLHFRVAGRNAKLNLVVDGYTLIMNPIYGGLTIDPGSDVPAWRTMDVRRWKGHRAYVELSDSTIPMHALGQPQSEGDVPSRPDGYLILERVLASNEPAGTAASPSKEARGSTAAQEALTLAIDRWHAQRASAADVRLINWALRHGLLDVPAETAAPVATLLERYAQVEASMPSPLRAPALADGTGEDEHVFLRGNYKTLGPVAMRGPLEVLAGSTPLPHSAGSGRLELAELLVQPSNPLLARVLVNRLWQHHFGVGLVKTPDDFGRMGQPPTHPELLDYLATEFVERGWSIKALHRAMVLTSTYRMSSRRDREADKIDPENRLLHRMNVRRLEGEAIRDALLVVSGRLDETMFGLGVLPYLSPYMEGRGRPKTGPLDGAGRRSIYVNARRNFLTPLLLAFDYPVTFSTLGRREVTTVPAQALSLMNDPFVLQETRRWAERALAVPVRTKAERVAQLYQAAFARPPLAEELSEALRFLEEQESQVGADSRTAWAELCQVLVNVKEFYVVP